MDVGVGVDVGVDVDVDVDVGVGVCLNMGVNILAYMWTGGPPQQWRTQGSPARWTSGVPLEAGLFYAYSYIP